METNHESDYTNALKQLYKKYRDLVLFHAPKSWAHIYYYNRFHSDKLNLSNPLTYDEKVHWLMVNVYDCRYAKYADKIAVRNYICEKGYEKLLIPLVGQGVYTDPDQINFEEFPDQFIIKANHGSGPDYYYLCRDKMTLNKQEVINKMKKALNQNFALHFCQYHYDAIRPALICEQLLSSEGQERLTDYKVVCTWGKVIAILVCSDRDEGRDYYSAEWEYLEYVKPEYRSKKKEKRPDQLTEMLEAAANLSASFPLARVDFYIVNNHLYFGEITLTPSEGCTVYLNNRGQTEIGNSILLQK